MSYRECLSLKLQGINVNHITDVTNYLSFLIDHLHNGAENAHIHESLWKGWP